MMQGFINVDKKTDWTSHDVVAKLRSVLKTKKIGHTGTLDPAATGVLSVCVGQATKFSEFIVQSDKIYEACIFLGVETDTLDREGRIVNQKTTKAFPLEAIGSVFQQFLGDIEQLPPMYSAIKVRGQKLYQLARQGVDLTDRKKRKVHIDSITLMHYAHPFLSVRVNCSSGTYIRSLAKDIANALGTVGHLHSLRRIRNGTMLIEESWSMEEIEASVSQRKYDFLIPVEQMLQHVPKLVLHENQAVAYMHGRTIPFPNNCENSKQPFYRVYHMDGTFLGIGEPKQVETKLMLKIKKMFHPDR